MKTLN